MQTSQFNLKTKHIILIAIALGIGFSAIGKAVTKFRRSKSGKSSFEDDEGNIAAQMRNALYPDGKTGGGLLNKLGSMFDAAVDIDKIMQLAGGRLNNDNFKAVSSAYSKLYAGDDLAFDVQDRLDARYNEFSEKMNSGSLPIENRDRIIKTLAYNIYTDLEDSWSMADDALFVQLYRMNDADFEKVYHVYANFVKENETDGTLRSNISKSWSVDDKDKILKRFNKLGLV